MFLSQFNILANLQGEQSAAPILDNDPSRAFPPESENVVEEYMIQIFVHAVQIQDRQNESRLASGLSTGVFWRFSINERSLFRGTLTLPIRIGERGPVPLPGLTGLHGLTALNPLRIFLADFREDSNAGNPSPPINQDVIFVEQHAVDIIRHAAVVAQTLSLPQYWTTTIDQDNLFIGRLTAPVNVSSLTIVQ